MQNLVKMETLGFPGKYVKSTAKCTAKHVTFTQIHAPCTCTDGVRMKSMYYMYSIRIWYAFYFGGNLVRIGIKADIWASVFLQNH